MKINEVDLSSVPANILVDALSKVFRIIEYIKLITSNIITCLKIKDLEMSRTKLTIYQGIYLFSKLTEAKAKITNLKIDNNDLSLVPAEQLAKGIILKEPKIILIMIMIMIVIMMMIMIMIVIMIIIGVNKLTEVDLCGTRLTELQVCSVFLEMLDQSSVQKIALDGTFSHCDVMHFIPTNS